MPDYDLDPMSDNSATAEEIMQQIVNGYEGPSDAQTCRKVIANLGAKALAVTANDRVWEAFLAKSIAWGEEESAKLDRAVERATFGT